MTIHQHTEKAVFDAFEKEYPNREIKVAGGEDSIQVFVFPGIGDLQYLGARAYIHVIMGDDEGDAEFVCINDGRVITISIDAMIPPELDASQFASQPQEGDEAVTMASDAWQLLEVLSSDTAEYLIERDKMGPEIETITAREIIEAIARKGR